MAAPYKHRTPEALAKARNTTLDALADAGMMRRQELHSVFTRHGANRGLIDLTIANMRSEGLITPGRYDSNGYMLSVLGERAIDERKGLDTAKIEHKGMLAVLSYAAENEGILGKEMIESPGIGPTRAAFLIRAAFDTAFLAYKMVSRSNPRGRMTTWGYHISEQGREHLRKNSAPSTAT